MNWPLSVRYAYVRAMSIMIVVMSVAAAGAANLKWGGK
jgi:hypothetical protein